MADSLTKTKLLDPFILSLVRNIGQKKLLLEDLEPIALSRDLSNITGGTERDKFFIKNELHKARGFRKLHVEIASFAESLKILHCVFFPDPKYNIPIFGLDLVKVNNVITAAIVDLSPVSSEINIELEKSLSNVSKNGIEFRRKIPDWGEIFSENVFFASLKKEAEQETFYKIVDEYLKILIELSKKSKPDKNIGRINERIFYQKKYCTQQMKNEKTSMVLLNYFEKDWVDRYIKEVLFDF